MALFMWLEPLLKNRLWQQIGSILFPYIYCIILYFMAALVAGALVSEKSLAPTEAIGGAIPLCSLSPYWF